MMKRSTGGALGVALVVIGFVVVVLTVINVYLSNRNMSFREMEINIVNNTGVVSGLTAISSGLATIAILFAFSN